MPQNLGSRPSDFNRSDLTGGTVTINTMRPTEYRISSPISSLKITVSVPSPGYYEAWIKFTAASVFSPAYPSGIKWIGDKLSTCAAGKTYEISIKDGVAIACEVGDAT